MKLWALLIVATMLLGGMLLSGVVLAKDIRGDGRNNNLTGTNGTDYIKGNGGADTIDGKKGADTISGGKGTDRLRGGRSNDWIWGDSIMTSHWVTKATTTFSLKIHARDPRDPFKLPRLRVVASPTSCWVTKAMTPSGPRTARGI